MARQLRQQLHHCAKVDKTVNMVSTAEAQNTRQWPIQAVMTAKMDA
jgi:hypothetical protein